MTTAVSLAATAADITADTVLAINVILMFHVLSTLTFIFGKCTEASAHMPVSSSFLKAGWTKVGEGAQAHSSDEAKTCWAQDKLYSIFVSCLEVRASPFPLIFYKLIVCFWKQKSQYGQKK